MAYIITLDDIISDVLGSVTQLAKDLEDEQDAKVAYKIVADLKRDYEELKAVAIKEYVSSELLSGYLVELEGEPEYNDYET